MTRAELLNAIVNGSLSRSKLQALERELTHDPSLAEELAKLLEIDLRRCAAMEPVGGQSSEPLAMREVSAALSNVEAVRAANDNDH